MSTATQTTTVVHPPPPPPAPAPAPGPRPTADPAWYATGAAGLVMLAGLVLVLARGAWATPAVAVSVAGAIVATFVLAPRAVARVHREPALLLLLALAAIGLLWALAVIVGVPVNRFGTLPGGTVGRGISDVLHAHAVPLVVMTLAATGGVVLIADALRVRLGLAGARRAPWDQLTSAERPAPSFPWRAIAGVLLVGWATFLGIGIAGPYLSGDPTLMLLVLMAAVVAAAVVIGTPLLIAGVARSGRDDAVRAQDDDRARFAAHLHDSVLQTLALVQRQAHDPSAVTRLARRQEHALRAWMAGEAELASETLVAALRDVVAEVEDEQGVTVELSVIGDRPLDDGGEALVAAAREALRNAAHHGQGAAIFVFAEITPAAAEVFVRDEGPGFAPDDVPTERRGIRDAIVGRMGAAGGGATIESAPGEGTEVALRLGPLAPRARR